MQKLLVFLIILISLFFLIDTPENQEEENKIIDDLIIEIKPDTTEPIEEFKKRITKKSFGIFITPETSPVQPERFTGYHTGVDIEYENIEDKVPVLAIADGIVKHSGWVSGYGGLLAIQYIINEQKYLAIYGHLNPASLVENNKKVIQGQQIGILGEGNTSETDFERKHLHFAIYLGSDINLRGYVKTQEELTNWLNPEIFLNN